MSTDSFLHSQKRRTSMARLPTLGKKLPLAYFLCAGTLLVSIAIVSPATTEPQPVPAKSEPHVLNLALPRVLVPLDSKTGKDKAEELEKNMRQLFEKLYCSEPDCKGNRPLQINIALGNDYQILDWLGKGLIDGAAIPPLSLYLLRRDDVDLVEIDPIGWRRPVMKAPGEDYVPAPDLESFWQEIWGRAKRRANKNDEPSASPQGNEGCPLLVPSHLSTPGFLTPVAATSQWLDKQLASEVSTRSDLKARDRLANEFWREFFNHLRFTFDVDQRTPANPGLACSPILLGGKQPGAGDYHLVITARRAATIFPKTDWNGQSHKISLHMKQAVAPRLDSLQKIFPKLPKPESKEKEDEERDSIPEAFRPIVFPEPYFGVRTFAFTIDESIDLLRQQHETKEDTLALVLPGGGVKAGFQSRLIEYLYENERLKNYRSAETARQPEKGVKALDVSYIIGTSGGALLGFFVAQIGDHAPPKLSKLLWQVGARPLQSTDVFGFFDLPRYFSFLAVLAMLCLVLWSPALRRIQGGTRTASQQAAPNRLWRLRLLLTIGPILFLTPLLVRYVNGEASKEHIPEIEGFFYTIFVLIAMFADQCLIRGAKKTAEAPKRWRVVAVLCLILGAAALFASVALRCQSPVGESLDARFCEPISFLEIQPGALLACIGALGLLMASIIGSTCSPGYNFVDRRGYFSGIVGVGLVHIVLVYLTLWALITLFPDAFSFLELTTVFWYWLLATAVVIAILLVWISYRLSHRSFLLRVVRNGVDYLSANHPNGNVVSRRFLRLLLLAGFAVGWWNFIVAPGLYGNKHATKSITEIITGFDRALDQANQPTDKTSYLTSRLIIPANVLERDGTRYFLFAPTEKDCPDLVRRPGDGATWRLFHVDGSRKEPDKISVKRCGAKETPYDLEYLKKVVFASGSPFPVFPAHLVDKEPLVDGGYSNNVPLDAAQTVSADLVLIVDSSNPLGHKSFSSWWRYLAIQGELIGSLPRLLSFLYERSQQIDRLSRSGLFVVSLAPPREEADWPFLVDFRPKTVKRMQDVAEKNLSKRIGMVQSWGRPRFQLTLRLGRPPQ